MHLACNCDCSQSFPTSSRKTSRHICANRQVLPVTDHGRGAEAPPMDCREAIVSLLFPFAGCRPPSQETVTPRNVQVSQVHRPRIPDGVAIMRLVFLQGQPMLTRRSSRRGADQSVSGRNPIYPTLRMPNGVLLRVVNVHVVNKVRRQLYLWSISMTDTALAPQGGTTDDSKRQARRLKALERIFGAKFVKTFASPFMVIDDHVIYSPVAIRFYKKDFEYLSKQLYLEYQYRSWKGFNADLLARYADITSTKLANIKILMTNTVNRLRKLLDQQGYKEDLTLWPAPFKDDVPIIAAHARSYIDMLKLLDEVNALAGTANLMGVIDSTQRAEAEYICKKAVRAFRSILQTEVTKLYREAERIIREQHSAGQVDQAMSEMVTQQGKDIAEFDKATQEEEHGDSSMDLKGADPNKLIDEAAAASTAATAAAGRKRTARAKPDADAGSAAGAPAPAAAATVG